jgi:transposase
MALYTGFDLHSTNTYVGIIDEDGKRIWKKNLRNDPNLILAALNPFKEDIAGVVVESNFNWYRAVDLLIEGGIQGAFGQSLSDPAVFRTKAWR